MVSNPPSNKDLYVIDTNTQTAMAPSVMETANMTARVAEAVTRDYSDLMKAIDKKKGK